MIHPADELHSLYELCVQRPRAVIAIIHDAHTAGIPAPPFEPRILHEDFAGSAAVSRAWIAASDQNIAVATDLDPVALDLAQRRAADAGLDTSRLLCRVADVRAAPTDSETSLRADAIFVGNFSIGELHSRDELLTYLQSARARLAPRGVFICDTYGGAAAFRTGLVHRTHPGREPRERVTLPPHPGDPLLDLKKSSRPTHPLPPHDPRRSRSDHPPLA
jgi:hypothetical protein